MTSGLLVYFTFIWKRPHEHEGPTMDDRSSIRGGTPRLAVQILAYIAGPTDANSDGSMGWHSA